jgi:CO/xanthine dehydrogenase Mo-binding subunit
MALKLGKPVKYRLTRAEDLLYSTKRGAWIFEYKDGVKKNGRLVARKVRMIHDTGAYYGMGGYVIDKQSAHMGSYYIPNFWLDGYCVFTNKPLCSSMRAFGSINGAIATEVQMNRIAEVIGMDPWEIRFMNAVREGDLTPNQYKHVAPGVVEAMKRAAELAGIELPAHLQTMNSQRR